ncbi:MAG: DHH family phosphoesterase [bacterium]|nr:DHH family phosphoesterase [bacterium]
MSIHLSEFLKPKYQNIVIQCHDNPDADAIASGYGIYSYLKGQGRKPRLVYGGAAQIQKSNLVRMTQILKIPLEYVQEIGKPDLLIMVDCQYGQRNVQKFSAGEVAVIDHHRISVPEELPPMQEIRSSYGACATVVWKLLKEAGYDVDKNVGLSTALYYGLYMDTGRLQEISHPDDKDMRDELKTDKSDLIYLQNANLSLAELRIVGEAVLSYTYNADYHFAVVEVKASDPNILGIVSDMLTEVDAVDTCIAFSILGGRAKLSVRSCTKEAQAADLAAFVCAGLGDSGGHLMKAGGTLDAEYLRREYESLHGTTAGNAKLGGFVREILCARMEKYFREQKIIDSSSYVPDIAAMRLYRKKPERRGYVEAKKIFPVGTKICIRMLEGEIETVVEEDTYIMTGVDYEVYVNRLKNFDEDYDRLEEVYVFDAKVYSETGDILPKYKPIVRNALNGEIRELTSRLSACMSKDTSRVYAQELTCRTKIFTAWDREKYMLGEAGDYLVVKEKNHRDVYIVKKDIFAKTYEACGC